MASAVHPNTVVKERVRASRSKLTLALEAIRASLTSGSVSKADALRALDFVESGAYKVGDAQKVLGVKSPTTIKKWIDGGRFPGAYLLDGQWHIPAVEVNAFRDAGERAARRAAMPGPAPVGVYEGDPFRDFS